MFKIVYNEVISHKRFNDITGKNVEIFDLWQTPLSATDVKKNLYYYWKCYEKTDQLTISENALFMQCKNLLHNDLNWAHIFKIMLHKSVIIHTYIRTYCTLNYTIFHTVLIGGLPILINNALSTREHWNGM